MNNCINIVLAFACLLGTAYAGNKETMYREGYDADTVPSGGWTGYFNSDSQAGTGDIETVEHIIGKFGDKTRPNCQGFPCSVEDIYIVQARTRSNSIDEPQYSPAETGDIYSLGMGGFKCMKADQPEGKECKYNYEIRFYCTGCGKCCMSNKKRKLLEMFAKEIEAYERENSAKPKN